MSAQASRSTAGSASAPVREVVVGRQEMPTRTRKNGQVVVLFKQQKVKTNYWDFIQVAAEKKDGWKPKNYKSSIACCAWCMICDVEVDYVVKVLSGVLSHLRECHKGHLKDKADADEAKSLQSTLGSARSFQPQIDDLFRTVQKSNMKKASNVDQRIGEAMLLYWVATSLRSFKIVTDPGFIQFCHYLNGLNTEFQITERTRLSKQMTQLDKTISMQIKYKIKKEMEWFCITTDIWTSRTVESFMAVTIHYLDDDFNMKEYVLEVRQFRDSHTAANIKSNLEDTFEVWGLDKENMTMLLRDNASNGVKACNDWGVNHFGCVAHCLHLIVGPFLLCSKKEEDEVEAAVALAAADAASRDQQAAAASSSEDATDDQDAEEGDIAPFDDPFSSSDGPNVKACRVIVNKIRTIIKFFRKSSKAAGKLAEFNDNAERVDLVLDCRTRWNSTKDMLANFLDKRGPIELFLSFLKIRDGIAAFGNKLPLLSPSEWALMEGLLCLLAPFALISNDLIGNKYPSFALAIPSLRYLLKEIKGDELFEDWNYDGDDREEIFEKLESCRKTILKSSEERLDRMVFRDGELAWVSYLDPRFKDGFIIDNTLNHSQKTLAVARLRDEAILLARLEIPQSGTAAEESSSTEPTTNTPPRPVKKLRPSLFDSPPAPASNATESAAPVDDRARLKDEVLSELEFYRKPVLGKRRDLDPLVWWRDHHLQFPHLARVARKWLSVCATSTASERVFSSCGLALNAKRAKMKGTTLEAQVKLKYNLPSCGMSIDQIAETL